MCAGHSPEYANYMDSPQWQVNRARRMDIARGICEDCNGRTAREVHHLTYTRMGHEPDDDLVALCHACHRLRHGHGLRHNRHQRGVELGFGQMALPI